MVKVFSIDGVTPVVHPTAFVHPRAVLIGDVIVGQAVSEVVESNHVNFRAGDIVIGRSGWQTHWIAQRQSDPGGPRRTVFKRFQLPPAGTLAAIGCLFTQLAVVVRVRYGRPDLR